MGLFLSGDVGAEQRALLLVLRKERLVTGLGLKVWRQLSYMRSRLSHMRDRLSYMHDRPSYMRGRLFYMIVLYARDIRAEQRALLLVLRKERLLNVVGFKKWKPHSHRN